MSDENWKDDSDDEIPEIRDFSGGIVGKYYGRVQLAKTVVELDPDSPRNSRTLTR